MTSSGAARHLRPRPEVLAGGGDKVEAEYAKDTWDAFALGIAARRGRNIAHFEIIEQVWLREAIKRWSRFRLGAGYTFTTIDAGTQALARWSFASDQRWPAPPTSPASCCNRSCRGWPPATGRPTPGRTPSPSPRSSSSGVTATTRCPACPPTPSSTKRR